ncbi:MAG TPA: DUF3253 domain-containing protein [Actinomycetales bacterium]
MPGPGDRLDATDARLLLALSRDPRATVLALSQQLGLARNTVQGRLARLEAGGALDPFERRVRPEALGYRLGAYVTVQVVQRSLAEVADGLAHIPEVLEVIGLSGVVDLLVEVAATDADDWRRLMPAARAVAGRLAAEGTVEVTQRGEVVDVATARGPVRVRRRQGGPPAGGSSLGGP